MASKTIRALACALLLESTACQQLNMPSVTDGACDLGTLPARVRDVDNLCCFAAASNPGARCAGGVSCDVPCAEELLPFLGDCHPMIDKIFDGDDGTEDGIAAEFDSVFDACMAIDPAEALAALADLKASGRCTDAQLNGVGETAVGEAPCADERLGCPHLIASGFMTCAADFGPTGDMPGQCDRTCAFCDGPAPPAPPCDDVRTGCSATLATGFVSCEADFCPTCPMANQCDKTCSLCSGRHRLQSARQCDLSGFADRATAVDRACCDDGVSCSAGVPTTCDAKCAVVFAPFFDSCSAILATQVDRESFGSYQRLHDTCATGLPAEALLQAAAACSTSVPCPALPPLAGASIAYSNGMVAPSVATYTCDGSGGPPQDGDATRTCREDGTWSGSAPTTCRLPGRSACRFDATASGSWGYSGGNQLDHIRVTVDREITLRGWTTGSPIDGGGGHADMRVIDESTWTTLATCTATFQDGADRWSDLMLSEPVTLEAGKPYLLIETVHISGRSYKGANGRSPVPSDGLTMTFSKIDGFAALTRCCEGHSNGSDQATGQIGHLIY